MYLYRSVAIAAVSVMGLFLLLSPGAVFAKLPSDNSGQPIGVVPGGTVKNCGSFLPAAACTDDLEGFVSYIANWMVGIFGALFVLMVVISGVQMASAGDSPDRLKAAKGRLMNAVTGLVLLILMRAILALFGISF